LQSETDSTIEEVPAELVGLEHYLEACVLSLPEWAQKLFEMRRALFSADKSGNLCVVFDTDNVSGLAQQDVVKMVLEYFENNKSDAIEANYIN